MSDSFQMVEAREALDYLKSFDAATRRKGEAYFREGRVGNVAPTPGSDARPGTAYMVTVQGTKAYEVELQFDVKNGWDGQCTCPLEFDCKHAYAAMKALLAENSLAEVRGISSGAIDNAIRSSSPAPSSKAEESSTLPVSRLAAAALNRPLRAEEARFCRKLTEVYHRCAGTSRISLWDFDDLGLSLGGHGWEVLKIWPEFPETEHEFWLYIANTAQERQVAIPKFLEPVTNLDGLKNKMLQWRRKQEIDQWKKKLGNLNEDGTMGSRGEFDLRLALDEEHAELQWKRPGQETFAPVKITALRQFIDDRRSGRIQLAPEAEVICEIIAGRLVYATSADLIYKHEAALSALGQLLRMKTLETRVVNKAGQQIDRAADPLRWELAPAVNAGDYYRFRLVQTNGDPLPELLCTIPGHPPLYVTRNSIFTGPPLKDNVLDPLAENAVPAPALETHAGIQFLHSFGIELPPRIRERVRHVPLQVAIRCELQAVYTGSNTENCIFHVTAEAKDGTRQETWNGQSWINTSTATHVRRAKNDESILIHYDRADTQTIPALLEPLGLKRDSYYQWLGMRVTKKFADVFVPWLKSVPPGINVRLDGELASFADAAVSGRVRLDVTETSIDWFDLTVVLDLSDTTLTPEEVKMLLNAKGGYVRLENKGWRRLQFDLSDEEDERLASLGLNPRSLSAEPQRLHALQLADESAKKFLPEQQVLQIQRRAAEIKARVTPDLPAGVTAGLRPYQLEGFHFLAYLSTNHFGGILADDMGLGKTLQALAWLVWLREQPRSSSAPHLPSLVVCPKSVMDNWHAEATRFTSSLRVKCYSARELAEFGKHQAEADVHVINYNQLRLCGEALADTHWLTVILDEGQYIKNPTSQTSQAARSLRSEHRLILSGTPIENRLLDLWSLMAFAMPGILSNRTQFARLYDSKEDPLARKRLAARVRPFLLRRTKNQVAKDLPDRIEEDLFCELEGEQKLLYRAELKRAQQMLLKVQTQQQLSKERFHFLTSLLRLRQICCHPALVNPNTKAASAKMEALLEQLEPLMEEGHKVLVFSQFVELLALLKPAIAERNWPMFYLAGETENRGDLVKQFQSTEGGAVFLISLKAGGFGLNLTAASYVVLFDPWWNPAVENQAIDRTHRIGQLNNVMAYRLLIKDSVEEKIRALQKNKSALAQDVFGEEKFAQSLTLDDLQFLLAD